MKQVCPSADKRKGYNNFKGQVKNLPSAKVLEAKKAQVEIIKGKLDSAVAGILVDYKGITVADDTKLRADLRNAGVDYAVTKNTLLRIAVEGTKLADMDDLFNGTTALAVSDSDYVAAAKILSEFAKTHENFKVKGGFIDGEPISLEKIDSLAKLPNKETLLATVVYAFQAPMAAFARAIQAVADKAGAPAEEAAPAAEEAPAEAAAEEAPAAE